MTLNNDNYSVLPFYESEAMQECRRRGAQGMFYGLRTKTGLLPPFQVIMPLQNIVSIEKYAYDWQRMKMYPDGENGEPVHIWNATGSDTPDYFTQIDLGGGYMALMYDGQTAVTCNDKEGYFALVITTEGGDKFFSEPFCTVGNTANFLRVEWWDDADLMTATAGIYYGRNPKYRNILLLQTELGMPDYRFDEEGEERDGYFFPEKQLSEKTYRFSFVAPEYVCDAMRLIRLSDHKRITDKFGRVYNCDTFEMSVEWQTGYLAAVTCEFETATVVKKLAALSYGDFNNDFNDDYNKA